MPGFGSRMAGGPGTREADGERRAGPRHVGGAGDQRRPAGTGSRAGCVVVRDAGTGTVRSGPTRSRRRWPSPRCRPSTRRRWVRPEHATRGSRTCRRRSAHRRSSRRRTRPRSAPTRTHASRRPAVCTSARYSCNPAGRGQDERAPEPDSWREAGGRHAHRSPESMCPVHSDVRHRRDRTRCCGPSRGERVGQLTSGRGIRAAESAATSSEGSRSTPGSTRRSRRSWSTTRPRRLGSGCSAPGPWSRPDGS